MPLRDSNPQPSRWVACYAAIGLVPQHLPTPKPSTIWSTASKHITKLLDTVQSGRDLALSKSRVLGVAGIPATTYNRHLRTGTNLPPDATAAVTRLLRLHAIATEVLPAPNKWFLEPTPMLDGESPLGMANTEAGGRAVEDLRRRIEYGSAA